MDSLLNNKGPKRIDKMLTKKFDEFKSLSSKVNDNVNKDNTINVNAASKEELLEALLASFDDGPEEGVARTIAEKLGDLDSLDFHRRTVKKNNSQVLFEVLAETMDAKRRGKISTTPARFYVMLLKAKKIEW